MVTDSLISKNWMQYASYLQTGQWHVHTHYTDGSNSVADYCEKAATEGIPLIVFSEHVRKELGYDFGALLTDIEAARKQHPQLIILSGCEVKVNEYGELDVSKEVLEQCQIVLIAFHSFPKDINKYYKALKSVLAHPKVDIWAHPGLFLKKNQLTLARNQTKELLDMAHSNKVLIEYNTKYDLPFEQWKPLINSNLKVRGDDIHSVEVLKK